MILPDARRLKPKTKINDSGHPVSTADNLELNFSIINNINYFSSLEDL